MQTILTLSGGVEHIFDAPDEPCPVENERDILAKKTDVFKVMSDNVGNLFDPYEATHKFEITRKQNGRHIFALTKCSEACYNEYTGYLRTRSRAKLRTAERRFIDGAR
jgi:hypothetical protein